MIYDSVIIGAGPAGLAFANYAKKHNPNEKIIIIEKDNVIGGCHKVNRKKHNDEFYFCEHGPRVYIGNYVNFISLLKSMKLDFKELFGKKYSIFSVLFKSVFQDKMLGFFDFLSFARDFILVLFDNKHGINISMYDYMVFNNFSKEAMINIDFLCSSIDGGNSKMISLNNFINTTIQTFLYSIYIPKKPNDEALFNYWYQYLYKEKKVDFLLNSPVAEISFFDNNKNKVESFILKDGRSIKGKKFIFAIPPINQYKIKGLKEAFELKEDYVEKTEYLESITLTLHWDYELNLENDLNVFNTKTEWFLIADNMTEIMKFKERKSKTVISCAIVLTDVKGRYIDKTANECSEEELFEEVYQQLRLIYKNIPRPTLIFNNNYFDTKKKQWHANECAFVKIPNYDYLDFNSNKVKNIYSLGTHNGKQKNSFTSLESAISNSIKLSNIIFNKKDKIKRCFDLRDLTIVIISIILLLLIIRYTYSNYDK
jgi:hypothetical protein